LEQHEISDIIQMALSDHVSFADIEGQYGLKKPSENAYAAEFKTWELSSLAQTCGAVCEPPCALQVGSLGRATRL